MKFNLLIIDRFQENVFGFVCSIKLEVEHSKKVRVRKMFQCQVTSPLIRIFSVAEMNRGGRGQLAPAPAAASTLIFDLGAFYFLLSPVTAAVQFFSLVHGTTSLLLYLKSFE